jgi:integrase
LEYGDDVFDEKGNRVGVVFHCLRHTRICTWLEMGLSDEVVRMMSGHKSLESFRKYVHLNPLSILQLFNKTGEKQEKNRARLTASKV